MRVPILILPALALLLSGCASVDPGMAEGTAFVSHRGAFGTDTSTVDEGTAEYEFGVDIDPDADAGALAATAKWGAGPAMEVYFDAVPYAYESQPGDDVSGIGDLAFGLRHRFREQDLWPSLAYQFQVNFPTGDESEGLSSGRNDFLAAAIATREFGNVAATAFYEIGVIGDEDGGTDPQHSMALVTEVAMASNWGFFGEFVAIDGPDDGLHERLLGGGLGFNLTEHLAWDVGGALGLNDDTADVQIFFGLTWSPDRGVSHHH